MHEFLVILALSVLAALGLLIVALILFAVAFVVIRAARELRKEWRGER